MVEHPRPLWVGLPNSKYVSDVEGRHVAVFVDEDDAVLDLVAFAKQVIGGNDAT